MSDFLEINCDFLAVTQDLSFEHFDCDENDLNEFFREEVNLYTESLLGKSYAFVLKKDHSEIVCAFTVSNDSLRSDDLPSSRRNKIRKNIPHRKHRKDFSAVKIGRLGVSKSFAGNNIGTELMDFIKGWFRDPYNKTGCRFIVVDAYNTDRAKSYYEKNGFGYLFSSIKQEKEYYGIQVSDELKSRMMYFDLYSLKVLIFKDLPG